jgi:hypothetical protein
MYVIFIPLFSELSGQTIEHENRGINDLQHEMQYHI